jgi:hypothetical protein
MEDVRGSEAAIAKIVKLARGISVAEMTRMSEMATAAGGSLVALDADGDWCGNGRFRFKWPPKNAEFHNFLDFLVKEHITFTVLNNGTPVPDEILVNTTRRIGR